MLFCIFFSFLSPLRVTERERQTDEKNVTLTRFLRLILIEQDVALGSLGGNENIVNPTQTDDNKIFAATRKGKSFVPRKKFSNPFAFRAATVPLEPTYQSRDDTNQKEKPPGWIVLVVLVVLVLVVIVVVVVFPSMYVCVR